MLKLFKFSHFSSFSVAMFYRNRSDQRPHILPLPGCPTPCPLPLFIHLTRTAIPEDWDAECQNPQSGPGNEIILPLLLAQSELIETFKPDPIFYLQGVQ